MNGARAIGPAVAGALVAVSGPTLVFALNAVSFIGIVVVLVWWRRPVTESVLPAEQPLAALTAGGRFIRSSPIVRRILLRSVLFILPGSALWGLLPVAKDRLGLTSSGYGLLLGALGVGAVVHSRCRPSGRCSGQNMLLIVAALGFAGATAVSRAGAASRCGAGRVGRRWRGVAACVVDAQRVDHG